MFFNKDHLRSGFNFKYDKYNGVNIMKPNSNSGIQSVMMGNIGNKHTEKMSEITVEDFKNLTSQEIHNKIRCLQDPYPNAFIKCKDGSVLFLKKSNYSL